MELRPKNSIVITLTLLIGVVLWLLVVAPILVKIPSDFHYQAEVFSIDNFYDEATEDYSGGKISVTRFSYDAVAKKDGILLIKNIFDVRTIDDEKIFSVERFYGVNPKTGKHVSGYGDRDRDGYLFAPRHLKAGTPYAYWHINYDTPAYLEFQEEEKVGSLSLYRYEVDYHADQTANLGHLPGVGDNRGVNLDINLQVWVEPVTGHLVKYEDQTTAYYYDLPTGERIYPWNKFHNRYTQSSIAEHVRIAREKKTQALIIEKIIPIGLIILIVVAFLMFLIRKNLK